MPLFDSSSDNETYINSNDMINIPLKRKEILSMTKNESLANSKNKGINKLTQLATNCDTNTPTTNEFTEMLQENNTQSGEHKNLPEPSRYCIINSMEQAASRRKLIKERNMLNRIKIERSKEEMNSTLQQIDITMGHFKSDEYKKRLKQLEMVDTASLFKLPATECKELRHDLNIKDISTEVSHSTTKSCTSHPISNTDLNNPDDKKYIKSVDTSLVQSSKKKENLSKSARKKSKLMQELSEEYINQQKKLFNQILTTRLQMYK